MEADGCGDVSGDHGTMVNLVAHLMKERVYTIAIGHEGLVVRYIRRLCCRL